MEERSLGFEIKLLNNMILRKIIKDSKEYGECAISPIQIKVVHYLIEHKTITGKKLDELIEEYSQ